MNARLSRLSTALLVAACLVAPASAGSPSPQSTSKTDDTVTVYVTKTGSKYHRAGCRSLSKSQIPMALKEAATRYQACKVCKPPGLNASAAPQPASSPKVAASATSDPGRCQAITKKGTQCKRRAQPGRQYCWQH